MWIGLCLFRRMEMNYIVLAVFCAAMTLMAIDIISLETLDVITKEHGEVTFKPTVCKIAISKLNRWCDLRYAV